MELRPLLEQRLRMDVEQRGKEASTTTASSTTAVQGDFVDFYMLLQTLDGSIAFAGCRL